MDLEHFMEIFLALRSNHEPRLLPMPSGLFFLADATDTGTWPDRLENVFDFCSILMSILEDAILLRQQKNNLLLVQRKAVTVTPSEILIYQEPWQVSQDSFGSP